MVWGVENGIISGYGQGLYGPDDPVTREQLVSILYRYAINEKMDVSVGDTTRAEVATVLYGFLGLNEQGREQYAPGLPFVNKAVLTSGGKFISLRTGIA